MCGLLLQVHPTLYTSSVHPIANRASNLSVLNFLLDSLSIKQSLDSKQEDNENIALLVNFCTTRITLHGPIRGPSPSNCCRRGCGRYSAARQLEVLLDEDDLRRYKLLNSEMLCFFHNCV